MGGDQNDFPRSEHLTTHDSEELKSERLDSNSHNNVDEFEREVDVQPALWAHHHPNTNRGGARYPHSGHKDHLASSGGFGGTPLESSIINFHATQLSAVKGINISLSEGSHQLLFEASHEKVL